jgi:5-methylcytosine-specific restriction endonuclease McrA
VGRYFDKPTKRARLKISGGKCEGEGPLYGLPENKRCEANLAYGVEFDHLILYANSRDSSLDNCRAVCPACHAHKTGKHDTPKAAKTLRQQDKNNGIRKKSTFQASRSGRYRKKINGEVEIR